MRIYFCDLSTGPSYLVVADHAGDCFDVIEASESIRDHGAVPSMLNVQFADDKHLTDHHIQDEHGDPWTMNRLQTDCGVAEVIWSSAWD